MNHRSLMLLIAALILAACSPATGSEIHVTPFTPVPAADEATPTLHPDAEYYAADRGISLEEAAREMAFQEQIGGLQEALNQYEGDIFGGLWLEHEPQFGVVVLLTEGGDEVIAQYLNDPALLELIDVRPADYTYSELTAALDQPFDLQADIDVPMRVEFSVKDNRVQIFTADPDALQAIFDEQDVSLADGVVLVADPILADYEAGRVDVYEVQGRIVYLPLQPGIPGGPNDQMEALMQGDLVEQNGCLYVASPNGDALLVIWQPGYTLNITDAAIEVLDANETIIGRIGESIALGGGETGGLPNMEGMPIDGCPGPYWIAGDPVDLQK